MSKNSIKARIDQLKEHLKTRQSGHKSKTKLTTYKNK